MPAVAKKVSKDSVNYKGSGGPNQCQFCRNFRGPSACARVEGKIAPKGWCKLWAAKSQKYDRVASVSRLRRRKKKEEPPPNGNGAPPPNGNGAPPPSNGGGMMGMGGTNDSTDERTATVANPSGHGEMERYVRNLAKAIGVSNTRVFLNPKSHGLWTWYTTGKGFPAFEDALRFAPGVKHVAAAHEPPAESVILYGGAQEDAGWIEFDIGGRQYLNDAHRRFCEVTTSGGVGGFRLGGLAPVVAPVPPAPVGPKSRSASMTNRVRTVLKDQGTALSAREIAKLLTAGKSPKAFNSLAAALNDLVASGAATRTWDAAKARYVFKLVKTLEKKVGEATAGSVVTTKTKGEINYDAGDVQAFYDMQIASGLDPVQAIRKTSRLFKLPNLKINPAGRVQVPEIVPPAPKAAPPPPPDEEEPDDEDEDDEEEEKPEKGKLPSKGKKKDNGDKNKKDADNGDDEGGQEK